MNLQIFNVFHLSKRQRTSFLTIALIFAVITATVIDHASPLNIQSLRLSWFGESWNVLLTILGYPVFWISLFTFLPMGAILTLLPGYSWDGFLDGSALDPYFMMYASILFGVYYSYIGHVIYNLAKRVTKKK